MFGHLHRLLARSQHIRNTVPPRKVLESSHCLMSAFPCGDKSDDRVRCLLAKAGKRHVGFKAQQAVDIAHDTRSQVFHGLITIGSGQTCSF